MVSRNLERANENDGFQMTALEYKFNVYQSWEIQAIEMVPPFENVVQIKC